MAKTLFYTKSKALGMIAARANVYAAKRRDDDAYAWLYKKMAYATATAGATLSTQTGGGLGTTPNSLYNGAGPSVSHLPKPHLVSLKTSYSGNYGSIQKCDITFTVYSLDQLDSYQGFFTINGDISANWGWENAGNLGGSESFKGKVVNFGWSINADGSVNCSSTGIGKGTDTLSTSANAGGLLAWGTKVSGLPNAEIFGDSIMANINAQRSILQLVSGDYRAGYACQNISNQWLAQSVLTEKDETGKLKKQDADRAFPDTHQEYFISLEQLCQEINNSLIKAYPLEKTNRISCNNDVTVSSIPKAPFASANPRDFLFPGAADYGKRKFTFSSNETMIPGSKGVDVSKILINVNFVAKTFETLGAQVNKDQQSGDTTLDSFFKQLFAAISINSGGAFQLAMAIDQEDQSPYKGQAIVIESQYMDDNIDVCPIPAVTERSVCRAMSLSAKIPDKLKSVASTAAVASGGSDKNTAALKRVIPGAVATKPDHATTYTKDNNPLVTVGLWGPVPSFIAEAQAFLRKQASGANDPNKHIIYPLDFSFTIDGVSGLEFGNAVSTNYMPAIYNSNTNKAVFTVLTVEHNVSGNDWTTSCTTVFRIRP